MPGCLYSIPQAPSVCLSLSLSLSPSLCIYLSISVSLARGAHGIDAAFASLDSLILTLCCRADEREVQEMETVL